jgi:hypothetical protein
MPSLIWYSSRLVIVIDLVILSVSSCSYEGQLVGWTWSFGLSYLGRTCSCDHFIKIESYWKQALKFISLRIWSPLLWCHVVPREYRISGAWNSLLGCNSVELNYTFSNIQFSKHFIFIPP